MEKLEETVAAVADRFAEAEENREMAIRLSRKIVRSSKKVIHSIHEGGADAEEIKEMEKSVRELASEMEKDPSLAYAGPASDALSEYAEAVILRDLLAENRIPSFEDLSIDERSWVLGLADVVGELRRIVLKKLMEGKLDEASSVYGNMEEIVHNLLMFDVPDAIVPLRRKQDVARGVMERTRSDIATAVIMSKI
ncbi:MAG: RNA-binding protein [Candidatus Methanomethylophilaceae archaeon]|jgi:translin